MTLAQRLFKQFEEHTGQELVLPGLENPVRALIAGELIYRGDLPILIGKNAEDAENLHQDLCFMLGIEPARAADRGILFIGSDEKGPYEEYSPDARAVMERINALYRLQADRSSLTAAVLTPQSLVRKHIPPAFLSQCSEYLIVGEEIDRQHLLEQLTLSGYNPVSSVEDPGTFSVRGGIVDIFSPHLSHPIRVDLFGDEIESLHLFEPSTHRNILKLEDALILPAREIAFEIARTKHARQAIENIIETLNVPSRKVNAILNDIDNHIHFFGIETLLPLFHPQGLVGLDAYLPHGEDVVVITSSQEALTTLNEDTWVETELAYQRAIAQHQIVLPPEAHLTTVETTLTAIQRRGRQLYTPDVHVQTNVPSLRLNVDRVDDLRGEILRATRTRSEGEEDVLLPLTKRLKKWHKDGLTTFIVCQTRGQAERLKEITEGRDVTIRLHGEPFSIEAWQTAPDPHAAFRNRATSLKDRHVHAWIVLGELSSGFALPSSGLAFLSEEQIFGARIRRRRTRRPAAGEFVSDLADLCDGDYVVHADFGVGQYKGLTKLIIDGIQEDYLLLEYKGQEKLYLPVHRLRLIQKYVGSQEGRAPALDKLGGTTWTKTKQKVKDHLLKMAAELLRLYAQRQTIEGYAFPPPDESFRQFEAEFEHEPTPDQAKAVEDVVRDLQKPSPMDRVICGDVGYGKTEVAMRATMMAVVAGRQTAILVPTTVLAAQHFQVFSKRFENFGVNLGVVSRFQTREEIKNTLAKLKDGLIDIVVGTHRLIGKDVSFKKLGLLVIDEEHRFGVSHKERLKKYRSSVHVLSMSATPIPRTLHMGFMGVRDMSMIATPPEDRLAVTTEVQRFSEEVIRETIVREIRRGGQAFVVHNRVASIDAFARMLERTIPEARIAVGHGQMDQERLEQIMVDFMNKNYNVLLATTIIESGIDIPSANTMIVNRADLMGLAQLYQLKGRVGRSRTRGFCYFLIPSGNLTPKARRRIAVLQRFTELGAGFKVASKDMEIRGAGNLLGKQQSGNITKVGFDMYQALLQEAISELKGRSPADLRPEPEIRLPVTSLIPDNYIEDPGERLNLYRRFNNTTSDTEAYDTLQEISDLYGKAPPEVENLAHLMLIKQNCSQLSITNLEYAKPTKSMGPRLVLHFDERFAPSSAKCLSYVQKSPQQRRLIPEGRLMLLLEPSEDQRDILNQTQKLLTDLHSTLKRE
ncbi:MAG: transcription-repair coupling factor [Myxococcales bacterium]|nr:transcription-repair coupling factor [Myxococcales bacterium]